jgi:hypothetical protein
MRRDSPSIGNPVGPRGILFPSASLNLLEIKKLYETKAIIANKAAEKYVNVFTSFRTSEREDPKMVTAWAVMLCISFLFFFTALIAMVLETWCLIDYSSSCNLDDIYI